MPDKMFKVRFWGARGSMAASSDETQKYGGNTACVEVTCGSDTLILDAGSGLRALGDRLVGDFARIDARGMERRPLHMFFTHCHYDHISGLPFFAPFFDEASTVNVWSGHLKGPDKTARMMDDYMGPPFFPVGPEVFRANVVTHDFEPGDTLEPFRGVVIRTLSLPHHDGCVGYRIDFDGRAFCYMTDTSHTPGEPNMELVEFCRGAECMAYDATYTDGEFSRYADFGHSTWQEGMRLAKLAGVKRYLMFHHRPSRTDSALDDIVEACRAEFTMSDAAREGMVVEL
ncbi:MBL fold metallo-hydrolase [Rhizobiaceae bacterium]|nr:MBL fold metallo-hydrolase [Rhizobiaceae bacterium]